MVKELYESTRGRIIALLIPHLNEFMNVEEIKTLMHNLERILREEKVLK